MLQDFFLKNILYCFCLQFMKNNDIFLKKFMKMRKLCQLLQTNLKEALKLKLMVSHML